MFTAEASRKDQLTTETVEMAAESHAVFEKSRLIVREAANAGDEVDSINLEYAGTNEGVPAKTSPTDLILADRPLTSLELGLLPFELTNRQGKTGVMIESVDDSTSRAVVKELILGLPLGDAIAFNFPAEELEIAQQNGYQWVRGGKKKTLRTGVNGTVTASYRGSRKSTKKVSDSQPMAKRVKTKTMFSEMPGSVKLAISIRGHRNTLAKNRVVGVPWDYSASSSQLSVRSYSWSGAGSKSVPHIDLKPSTPRVSQITEGLVEPRLGPQGFPVASHIARDVSPPPYQFRSFDPTTYELLWWRPGQSGNRIVTNPTTGQTPVPFSWTNQSLPNEAGNTPRFRVVHLSGGFEVTSSSHRKSITMSLTSQDDAWVFINGQLVMDMGGLHSTLTSSRFERDPIIVGKNRIDIFHANRGGTQTLGFVSNARFTPEAPFILNTDHSFDSMGASIEGGSLSSHFEMIDGAEVDADRNAITLNQPNNKSDAYSLTYDAYATTGQIGTKFSHVAVTTSIHSSAWKEIEDLVSLSTGQVNSDLILQAYQRDRETDQWRPVPVVLGQVATEGSYRRTTLMTQTGILTDRFVAFVFNPNLTASKSSVKVTQVSFGYREGDLYLPVWLAPPTNGTTDYLMVAGNEIHVENLGVTTGGVYSKSLKIMAGPWSVVGHVNVESGISDLASNPLLTIINGQLRKASKSPASFKLSESSFISRANTRLSGPVTLAGTLNPPPGEPLLNLFIDGDASINSLAIPNGGTIFVTGDLTINNSVTTDANRNIQWLVKGDILIPNTAGTTISLERQILCAEGKIEIYRPVVFSGAMRTNGDIKWIGTAGQGGGGAFVPIQVNGGGFSLD